MTKRWEHRLGWVILVTILVMVVISLIVVLTATRTELAESRQDLMAAQSAFDVAREQEQIQALIRISVVSYTEGDKRAAVRFLEYAISKMADRDHTHLGALPAQMLRDPIIAKKLGIKLAKGPQKNRRFGGG